MNTVRPFFSIVIPCYNDGRYAPGFYLDRLLDNLVSQGVSRSELEVIIADDHSPMPYTGTIDKYSKKLNIKYIQTDYNCCPGNTREKGASIVTGQWLCFADHDDRFYPKALARIKQIITFNKESRFVYCDFNKVDPNDETKVVEEFRPPHLSTWIHGKFYNVDKFWRRYNVHFIKDLKTHEDIALGEYIDCILHKLGQTKENQVGTYVDKPIYMWTDNPRSISNTQYVTKEGHPFLEVYFKDYLTSRVEPYIQAYKNNVISDNDAKIMCLSHFLSSWLVMHSFRGELHREYLTINNEFCGRMWNRLKEELNITKAFAKVLSANQLSNIRQTVDNLAKAENSKNLFEWLDELDSMQLPDLAVPDAVEADTEPIISVDDNAHECIELNKNISDSNQVEDINDSDLKVSIDDDAVVKEVYSDSASVTLESSSLSDETIRPFFSIIIPCYNDGRYAKDVYLDRLLSSLSKQGIPRQELEVVLSDDCSPVSFDDIVTPYEDKFIIRRIKTDYNCCPGNTRAKGVSVATGQWLAFADHDDIYYDGALSKVKQGLLERNEKYFAFGDFYGVTPEGEINRKFEKNLNWCHGKFYNKDNFWDAQNIHFIKDLKSHEDIAICTQVACAIHALGFKELTYFHFPVYAWTDNPQSVSHAKYTVETETGPREFLEVFLDDYIHATGYLYIEKFKTHEIKITFAIKSVLEIMCYLYFYMQGFQFRRPDDFYKANIVNCGRFVKLCKQTFNLTNETIYRTVASGNAAMWYEIRNYADPGSGRYIPSQTFSQWLDLVSCYYP